MSCSQQDFTEGEDRPAPVFSPHLLLSAKALISLSGTRHCKNMPSAQHNVGSVARAAADSL